MSEQNLSRRKFVKAAAIAAPVLLAYQKSALAGHWKKSEVKSFPSGGSYGKGGSICPPKKQKVACNQGRGNGPESCDPGNSNHHNQSNDEWPFKIKGPRPGPL